MKWTYCVCLALLFSLSSATGLPAQNPPRPSQAPAALPADSSQEPNGHMTEAEKAAAKAAAPLSPAMQEWQKLVTREFGTTFTINPAFEPMRGDLDGDGTEDLVLVAGSKNPMGDEAGSGYRVLDPYDEYFGMGNPKYTAQFASSSMGPSKYVLVIHNWSSQGPKAKFVIINLPFVRLSLTRKRFKKISIDAISAEEGNDLGSSVVYWNGKKYKWTTGTLGD